MLAIQHSQTSLTIRSAQDRAPALPIDQENADMIKTKLLAHQSGDRRKQRFDFLDGGNRARDRRDRFELGGAFLEL